MEYVLINNRSALECWERGYAKGAILVPDCQSVTLACDVRSRELAAEALPGLGRPMEILVRYAGLRSRANDCHIRVWGRPLPNNSIYVLQGTNVAISAPWFCFLQMAARIPLPQAVLLGMELCGDYSTLPFSPSAAFTYAPTLQECKNGFVYRSPLLTPQSLQGSLEAALMQASESKALTAAKLVAANSRSPAESRHYAQLFMPKRRGGYGLPRPLLNMPVPLSKDLMLLAGRSEYVCDFLYLRKRLAIEYDGGYHWNGEQRLDDNLRELILDTLKIEVVRVDKHQLESSGAADVAARAIARRLGVRLRNPGKTSIARRWELQRQLRDYSFDLYA